MHARHPGLGRGLRAVLLIAAAICLVAAPGAAMAQSPGPTSPAPSASLDPDSVRFRISLDWDFPQNPDYEYFFWNGSASVDGSLAIDFLRDEPVGPVADTPMWPEHAAQAVEMFDAATCPVDQLTLDCGRCVEEFQSDQLARTDLQIQDRSASQVVVWVHPVTDPAPDDPQFMRSACVGDGGGVVEPWAGFGPMIVTFALGDTGITPTAVALADEYGAPPAGLTLTVEPLS